MRAYLLLVSALALLMFPAFQARAETVEYHLAVERLPVNVTGQEVVKVTVNGGIPAPVLQFTEGDEAVIHVTNKMKEPTSVHWHGLLLPGAMDGVPGFNGFPGIMPGETFTYRFPIRQSGTYWYHAHSAGQEQDGLYGALVIHPRGADSISSDRDYILLVSDFKDEDSDQIMANLKMSSDYYNTARRTVGDFFANVDKIGFAKAWKDAKDWGQMRMSPTDMSDVSGYAFLMNGKTPAQNWTGLFRPGERVRLRFINASAMSIYDVRIPGLKMDIVQADGQNVEPVKVDEFRFSPGETYDAVVMPEGEKAYTIAAESVDRSGFATGTLSPRDGMTGEAPAPRPRSVLTMGDMGMAHMEMAHAGGATMTREEMESGWANAHTPSGHKALDYRDLRYSGTQKDVRAPDREIIVRLGGNMERFIWTINGKKFQDADPIRLKYGERVRLNFINDTMMAHPMHLHGMFMQLENGQPPEKMPNKHTVTIAPGQTYTTLLTVDEEGEWAFHCHMQFHMMAGMMTKVIVARFTDADITPTPPAAAPEMEGGHHHAH